MTVAAWWILAAQPTVTIFRLPTLTIRSRTGALFMTQAMFFPRRCWRPVERWPTPKIENFRYMLRSGMMGWLTIMLDTTLWDAQQHAAAKEEIELYKSQLRPLIREGNLYHLSERPDGVRWDGIEYVDPKAGRGVVYAFRGSVENEVGHRFILRGLRPESRYQLRFHDHTAADAVVSGTELMKTGVEVRLPSANSSEIVFLEELSGTAEFLAPAEVRGPA